MPSTGCVRLHRAGQQHGQLEAAASLRGPGLCRYVFSVPRALALGPAAHLPLPQHLASLAGASLQVIKNLVKPGDELHLLHVRAGLLRCFGELRAKGCGSAAALLCNLRTPALRLCVIGPAR